MLNWENLPILTRRSTIQDKPLHMYSPFYFLQMNFPLSEYKFALLCFLTAFVITLISIPPIITLIRKYKLYDVPNARKEHVAPIPTMGGIAIVAGMAISLLLWFSFSTQPAQICFFLSVLILLGLGIMDDLKDLSAKYKFIIQIALAALMAITGVRITSFEGILGIHELPLGAQYTVTILAITGITNAFNLIDGIDGLAGGIGFMSLITLGFFLTMSGDSETALIGFALAGGVLAFLYFNFNPARIFMGDTGSLVLGFVIAVLSLRLVQFNISSATPVLLNTPVIALSIVLIPVYDTLRVFAGRIWNGKSPFHADRTHIHHLLTNQGYSHAFASKIIYIIHGIILIEAFVLKSMRAEYILLFLALSMLLFTFVLKRLGKWLGKNEKMHAAIKEYLG